MNILKYYNQNRIGIWVVIIAIIFLIIAIQAINGIIKNFNNDDIKNNTEIVVEEEYKNNLDVNILIEDDKVIEEKELIIDQFIRYCNAGKVEQAYDLLTSNCKKQLFPTLQIFKQNYYNINFLTTKLYSKEKFYGKTYKIKFYEDILSTGNVNSKTYEDYYTIVNESNNSRLNISSYIDQTIINKSGSNNIVNVNVVKKQIYTDYEEYEIEVTNLTNKNILLDSKEGTKTIYLLGNRNVKYYSLSHEILLSNLLLKTKENKKIFIKFSKDYNSNNVIKELIFSDIIEDYEIYENTNKKSEYKNRSKISVNF